MARIDAKNIDETLLNNFKSAVIQKHGKLRDAYGTEIEKALVLYLNEMNCKDSSVSADARTHTEEDSGDSQSPVPKKDHSVSTYYQKLNDISNRMKEVGAWETNDFQKGIAARLVQEKCGGDPRTVYKYTSGLEQMWVTGR